MDNNYGAPKAQGLHKFYVSIPFDRKRKVLIYEDYGYTGNEVKRVELSYHLWVKIRDDARRDFNKRLRDNKQAAGAWTVGKIYLDPFLGKELCVLAWAAEQAELEQCETICKKWLALRPEERWWLFSKTASGTGLAGHKGIGWRKALYYALS